MACSACSVSFPRHHLAVMSMKSVRGRGNAITVEPIIWREARMAWLARPPGFGRALAYRLFRVAQPDYCLCAQVPPRNLGWSALANAVRHIREARRRGRLVARTAEDCDWAKTVSNVGENQRQLSHNICGQCPLHAFHPAPHSSIVVPRRKVLTAVCGII